MAAVYGTPVYVYDLGDVRAAHAALTRALPAGSALYYSVKANPHPGVGAVLAGLGCRAEVASTGEIDAALRAGFAPADLLLAGPGKTADTMAYALARGVRRISVDSPEDLSRAGGHGTDVDCLLRINADRPIVGMGLTMTGTASPFGADASWVLSRPEEFRAAGRARVAGLHLYMGTNIADPETLFTQLAASARLAGEVVRALGPSPSEVDLGGGFAMPYARSGPRPSLTGLAARLEPVIAAALPGGTLISFESGRHLVGGCGTLLCRVLEVKPSKGRTFVILDSGVHHLGGMSGLRRLPRVVPEPVPVGEARRPGVLRDCVITGPLCTPLDTWADGVTLPELRAGDLVAVPNTGAYGLTASLIGFLGHPAPAEVLVDGGVVVSASRLELGRVDLGGSSERALHRRAAAAPESSRAGPAARPGGAAVRARA
ncbi:MAG: type III PLP-dependent enzyme [Streptosporangiales bacterium]|nr:type III PLP-dependent enzyme [Streptosporangiales bacterium]